MFTRANIGVIVGIITAVAIYLFLRDVKHISLSYVIPLCYIDIWLFKIFFEYQRITLTISRVAKINNSKLSVAELQILLADDIISVLLFLKSFLTGFLVGYFLLTSWLFLIVFLIFEYLLNFFVPAFIPYDYLFERIEKELKKRDYGKAHEIVEKIRLETYFDEMPHDSTYENWALKKYGNELINLK